jgi:hypothetical protein
VKENEVLDKALGILNDALDGKTVDPLSLQTAVQMTQFFWSSVYSERVREKQIVDALRNKWSDSIDDETK